MEHLNIEIQLPITIYIDNIGDIYMARNNSKEGATRHVNYRYNYCREVHGKLVELYFVKSEDNEVDILTKNAKKDEHERDSKKLITNIPKELLVVLGF